jgi:alpha-glucosidase
MTMLALPGSAYIYQGQELGLNEVFEIPAEMRQDPSFITTGGKLVGRDGCRVPIPWDNTTETFGFNSGTPTWLPQPESWKKLTAAEQDSDQNSTLSLTRTALKLRKELPALGGLTDDVAALVWDEVAPGVLSFVRPARLGGSAVRCVMNMGKQAQKLSFAGEVLLVSEEHGFDNGLLSPDCTVWLTA